MLTELVREPEAYFAERVKYPTLRWQTVIVVLAGVIAHIWRLTTYSILGASSEYIGDVLLLFWLGGVIEFIVLWILLTWVMSFVAGLLGEKVRFGRLLRVSGYGFVPIIVSGAIWSAGYYIALQDVVPPEPPTRDGFRFQYEVYAEWITQIAGHPALFAAAGLGSLFVLVAGYLWYQAILGVTEHEGESAAIPPGVAVAIFIGWTFYLMF